jgi:hypothetical protein
VRRTTEHASRPQRHSGRVTCLLRSTSPDRDGHFRTYEEYDGTLLYPEGVVVVWGSATTSAQVVVFETVLGGVRHRRQDRRTYGDRLTARGMSTVAGRWLRRLFEVHCGEG